MDTDFDFKPINEGLGFHRKVKPLDAEADSDETFSFSTLGPGTLSQPGVESNSREQSKGLLSSGSATSNAAADANLGAKKKHNAKSVSDLIAALPPSLDFLLDDSGQPAPTATPASATSAASLRKSPLFSSPAGIATPGAPAAASMAPQAASATTDKTDSKRGFLKMPLGRNDYNAKSKTVSSQAASAAAAAQSLTGGTVSISSTRTPSSLDENVAKTFPSVFPHLGSLAGKPAAAAVKAATKETAKNLATALDRQGERHLATHFGSAVLDTLVAVGLGCVLLALALSITNANLLALLENTATDRETIAALALLFVAGGLLYVLAARSFMGATLGEWSYEIRVGERAQRTRWYYPLQVVWRGLLVTATGFITFPIISLIAGRDVLKHLTGIGLVALDGASADGALPALE